MNLLEKIEHVLENLDKISPSGKLETDLDILRSDILTKKATLRKLKESFDKDSCLDKVTTTIGNYVKLLPIETKENKRVILDPEKHASIRIEDTKTKNITFLSKIGSGANHMCYHLATLLGLHEYFSKLPEVGKINYVASLLVLDQPSQVYFPEDYPDKEVKGKKKEAISEDIENTTKIFSACAKFMERTRNHTQIIILEHAPKSTWVGNDKVHLVEEWRGQLEDGTSDFNALIQKAWLDI